MHVRRAEHFLLLDAKLPKILSGQDRPADTAERFALAEFCQLRCRQLYAASARFYSEVFSADPTLIDDPRTGILYGAGSAAALAGCGQGKDADKLEREETARLRGQALGWLRANLGAWRSEFERHGDKARFTVREEMQSWQRDSAFDGVRADTALAKLRGPESREWQQLWQEVEELRQRAAK
jgi:hypothetical protein